MRPARILAAAGALVLGLIGAPMDAEEQPWLLADAGPSGKEAAAPAPLAGLPAPVADYRNAVRSTDVETYSRAALALRKWMIENDPHRPIYHFTGPESWINDPNGPIYHGGKYHLFYQFDPIVDGRRSKRCWGHAVSDDLVHWKDWPVAVWPDTPYDQGGVYSGNTFVDDEGHLCGLYTGNVSGRKGPRYGVLIRSRDGGVIWQKKMVMDHSQRPNDDSPVHHDGYVWKENNLWCQLIGGSTGGPKSQGAAWLWTSEDLQHWTLQKNIAPSIRLGKFWELPYLIPLGPKHVLLVGAGNPYWVGRYDRHTMIFTPDEPEPKSMDNGTYYSFNVNMVDDKGPGGSRRQLMHGWVTGPATPTKSVPYWQGAHSIPRVLTLHGEHVVQQPIPEIETLRREHQRLDEIVIEPGKDGYLPDIRGDSLEIVATFDRAASAAARFGLKLRVSADGKQAVRVWYDPKTDQFGTEGVVVRKASAWGGITRNGSQDEPVVLRIFLDRSVLEVYCGGAALTNRTFADAKALGADLFAEGGTARLQSLDVWKMNPLWEP
jgi:beta-fructofuranosidase